MCACKRVVKRECLMVLYIICVDFQLTGGIKLSLMHMMTRNVLTMPSSGSYDMM